MEIWVLFGVFTLLLIIGTPVAFCLGIASLATILYMQLPPIVVFQQLNSGMNAFAMMAIPFFIYAGDLMMRGGIADRLIRLAAGLVGHLRGGLGQVNVVASTLFGGISGSAIADASAIGGIMIPQMEKRGYAKDYSVNVTVNAAIIALLIPPSHNMIIYSIAAGGTISVADLFTAGIVPGFLLAAALMITAYVVAVRRGYPADPFPGFRMLGYFLVSAVPGHPAHLHHLRRRSLRRLHGNRELLHRCRLRPARHALRLSRDELGELRRGDPRCRAHHRHGSPGHRHRQRRSAGSWPSCRCRRRPSPS